MASPRRARLIFKHNGTVGHNMALPRQVGLTIEYDGTVKESVTETVTSGGSSGTYTVKSGDTLWRISKIYLGSGARYMEIYNLNASVIEAAAKAHGKSSSSNGHWIWPGTVLTIPGATTTTTQTKTRSVGTSNPKLGGMIAAQATGLTYTDVASGKSDSISLSMSDIDMEWIGSKMPKRGAELGAKIRLTNWNSENEGTKTFDCGDFILDDISFSGAPLSCVLGGVSVPIMDDFKSLPRTQAWEKTTIQDIAREITNRAGITLYYDADTIQIAEIEQSKQTDSAFLYSLCEKYGLAMKVYKHKIVIFDFVRYEEKKAILTLKPSDFTQWSYNTTIEGTYTGVNLDYTDPDTDNTINVTMGTTGRMYSINTQASSRYDAELQAAARVNEANRKIETMQVTMRANTKIVASHCIEISGLGNANGKYFVEQIKHSIGSGYKMQLTLHKVQTPIKVTTPVAPSGGQTYTVVSGDTLWGISKRFYGTGTKYNIIYNANADIIESTAKAHGKSSSSNGHWIWPGEVFTIPEG